ncbi:MAG: FG-GAP repeat domain-containing protein [Pyrinomonadaceae bacterium]
MSLNIEPSKRRKLNIGVSACAIVCLIGLGIMARNGWLPHTDTVTGKRTGWFGRNADTLVRSQGEALSNPLPSGTPQLSKEYIYAGSRLLAVEDANANAAPPADLAVWRPSSGTFYVLGGPGSQQTFYQWGTNGDVPVPGDFDGDGKTDFSVFRPSTGVWWVTKSSDNTYYSYQFGVGTDIPAQADYDGDGRTDIAVWRPSTGLWYIVQSGSGGVQYATYGTNGDIPAPADYDGDGRADIGVFRDSEHKFYSINSSNSQSVSSSFANSVTLPTSSTPVSGDYDGDGKADYAVRNGNNWIIRNSSNPTTPVPIAWEQSTDKAVQNDYDGDGKVDIAVWRDANGNWYIRKSASNGQLRQEAWGMSGDIPVPAFYRRQL